MIRIELDRTATVPQQLRGLDALLARTVSVPDAAAAAGLSYRQVHYWIAQGAITPEYGTGGSGFPYRFSHRQVDILAQIGIVYRWLQRLELGSPSCDFIARVWRALELDGRFRVELGGLSITLPWPEGTELADEEAS